MTLQTILDNLRSEDLRKITKSVAKSTKDLTSKLHFSRVLTEIICKRPHEFLAALDEAESYLLAEIAHTGAALSAEAFLAKYGMTLPLLDSHWDSRDGISPMNCLIYTDYREQIRYV